MALATVLLLAPVAAAKTFVVNKRGDHPPNGCTKQDCTLREAVLRANARPGGDRIVLPSGKRPYRLTRVATLAGPDPTKGDLDLGNAINEAGNAVTIIHRGPGRATIDASAAGDRVIELNGVARLRKLVLRGGMSLASGGGVRSSGALSLIDARVVGNQTGDAGGGVYANVGSVLVRNGVIRGNRAWDGGGVFATSSTALTLRRSTVAANRADPGSGGGIWLDSGAFVTTRIIASTLRLNRAETDGGAIRSAAADLRIVNSTLAANATDGRGGGIYAAPASLASLNAVTIARNRADADDGGVQSGGGIYADGGADVVALRNSLVVRNRGTGAQVQECDAPAPVGIDSMGGNLITTTAGGCDFLDHLEDIVAPKPRIGKLRRNGGPTATIGLRKASPAINQGDGPAAPKRDQRGVRRRNPDIGAYERR
ncbi:MAG TPA: right-handed parallel beta-helix repeat-containing protein [Solirubrobacterales bacterium]|nr:right-handed parallel beta-helix repeat-containing protein [Solirubrobacterales bacterium]